MNASHPVTKNSDCLDPSWPVVPSKLTTNIRLGLTLELRWSAFDNFKLGLQRSLGEGLFPKINVVRDCFIGHGLTSDVLIYSHLKLDTYLCSL